MEQAPLDFVGDLEREIERALRYGRPLTLGIARCQEPFEGLLAHVSSALRKVDRAATDADTAWFILPEVDVTADIPARRILDGLKGACVGLARCPLDARDAVGLLSAAWQAASDAKCGDVQWARAQSTRLQIGQQFAIAADPRTQRIFQLVQDLAPTELPVLITGATGTGKEIIAKALHHWSDRKAGPLVCFNLAALPAQLAESELFGHCKGAFSGADSDKKGLLEAAKGGTLFLDEVAEAPVQIQVKLLRALETGMARQVGATTAHPFDARIIAATNTDIPAAIESGKLRADLYYRLEVGRVQLPPLHERPGDILPMAQHFLATARSRHSTLQLSSAACEALMHHRWPGNIRELRNVIMRAAAISKEPVISLESLGLNTRSRLESTAETPIMPLAEEIRALEERRIRQALSQTQGVRKDAAALLGMPQRTFVGRLKRYGIN